MLQQQCCNLELSYQNQRDYVFVFFIEKYNFLLQFSYDFVNDPDRQKYVCNTLVYCTIHISPNNLSEFPSATLSSLNDATASPRSAALQTENSFCVI